MSRGESSGSDSPLVTLEAVRSAAARIAGTARRTPLVQASRSERPNLWLKCENLQRVSAFKARGAYNFVSCLSDEARAAGLVSYSSGNHAQAVAFAARMFGVRATIVMPVDAPAVKLEATRAMGATVEQVGTTSSERGARALEIPRSTTRRSLPARARSGSRSSSSWWTRPRGVRQTVLALARSWFPSGVVG
jgi:threonine dehydratase